MKISIEDRIEQRVLEAIAERRLPPGAKLGEQLLSDIFTCNRANVRRALASLAAQNVVDLIPNRGAFVISPSPRDAKDVFQARRAIERTIVTAACDHATDTDLSALAEIIANEDAARDAGDETQILRLSSEFHLRIADVAGNSVLTRFLTDLTMRSALIIGLYGHNGPSHCDRDEHRRILAALAARDKAQLIAEMERHLSHLEADLDFSRLSEKQVPLEEILQP
ncbi:GntR family transcriptional regulator [Aliiroseovarius crassostreae]|uniref:GntR family transcriptional regulator n=1 Tax=Aliiroseovarius crassostreae TaxID=154981 RepID=UPI0022082796|nr:GntR family transcriptional regulator [Aliiroseovarius crassostreae]UWP89826.1 GntR family transcriptional regulator [Aliiroseovarius crassostreae]